MSDNWWKSPVLQGPENDYGDYDYLIEDIPSNEAKWELSKYKWKCDDCHKERHLLFTMTGYFRTLDGYDCNSWNTCWRCFIKEKIHSIKYGIKVKIYKQIRKQKETYELAQDLYRKDPEKRNFKFWYKIAKSVTRKER